MTEEYPKRIEQRPVTEESFIARLDSFKTLEPGWYDGKIYCVSYSKEYIDRIAELFRQYWPKELPWPYAYPVVEPEQGNQELSLRWDFPPNFIDLTITEPVFMSECSVIDMDSVDPTANDDGFLFDFYTEFDKLVQFVREHLN